LRAARLDVHSNAVGVTGERIAQAAVAPHDVWLERRLKQTDG